MKNRQRKKLIKKSILVYDVAAIPYGLTLAQVADAFKKGVLIYSSEKGQKPDVYPRVNIKAFKLEERNDK